MKVLVACEFSGIVRDAFAARGHDAWSCDLLPTERPGADETLIAGSDRNRHANKKLGHKGRSFSYGYF